MHYGQTMVNRETKNMRSLRHLTSNLCKTTRSNGERREVFSPRFPHEVLRVPAPGGSSRSDKSQGSDRLLLKFLGQMTKIWVWGSTFVILGAVLLPSFPTSRGTQLFGTVFLLKTRHFEGQHIRLNTTKGEQQRVPSFFVGFPTAATLTQIGSCK